MALWGVLVANTGFVFLDERVSVNTYIPVKGPRDDRRDKKDAI